MKIWRLEFELDEFDNLTPEKEWSIEKVQEFDGREQRKNWEPIKVVRLEPEKELDLSNAPGFYSHIPVLDKRAKDALKTCMGNSVEFLPLSNEEGEFWAVNVISVLDCLNYEKSSYITFPDGKRIYRFEEYYFDEIKLNDINIFKIKDEPLAAPFVSERFKELIDTQELIGFSLKLVWESEE